MTETLLQIASRYSATHADDKGLASTPFAGISIIRETESSALQFAISKPLVALVLQGAKRVATGSTSFDFGAGDSLVIAGDVPTVSQITRAKAVAPYLALVIELDTVVIEELVVEMGSVPFVPSQPLRVEPTEQEVADAALRLLRLIDRPASLPILRRQLVRELHYWLLAGRHGGAIRALGIADSHAHRIGRAVAIIRAGYAKPLRIDRLAKAAGMSQSAFHLHFRSVTSLTPLQFQKQLRLIEARRAMLADGAQIATAAHLVGYESVTQFTREYCRLFGMPPGRDMRETKRRIETAA
ncbi:AraC-like DNA-binding protein [Bradyrhizobium huanghuaihaiense]|uniref:AraC-like DNA-binding protein n=1 Tax=Bradyrhizobium huanghuaihaiense TaxID=990078 RepID=A0A562S5D5_9BRAD|nr:AraC family transcriptional regulator [Bradyrhizobium huanghuaihaiense]TWI76363.1 AraC-like DNA-binding protein [Bradyrhizobium huanghuaihaiense]